VPALSRELKSWGPGRWGRSRRHDELLPERVLGHETGSRHTKSAPWLKIENATTDRRGSVGAVGLVVARAGDPPMIRVSLASLRKKTAWLVGRDRGKYPILWVLSSRP
jgi:hypothetical protein